MFGYSYIELGAFAATLVLFVLLIVALLRGNRWKQGYLEERGRRVDAAKAAAGCNVDLLNAQGFLNASHDENERLKKELLKKQDRISALNKEFEKVNARLKVAQGDIETLNQSITELRQEHDEALSKERAEKIDAQADLSRARKGEDAETQRFYDEKFVRAIAAGAPESNSGAGAEPAAEEAQAKAPAPQPKESKKKQGK